MTQIQGVSAYLALPGMDGRFVYARTPAASPKRNPPYF